jgi:phosphomevalonate kinase
MSDPRIILLFSGKRKSGKDHICDKIKALLGGERCTIVRISGPLKRLYAQNHKLDFQELLSDGPYKEIYRVDMINWSDKIREKDPGYFCKAASEMGRWVGD